MFLYTHEVVDYMVAALGPVATTAGINGTYEYENNLTPKTPALLVIGLPREREYVGAHNFKVTFKLVMFIVNANMALTKSQRQAACEMMSDPLIAYLDANQSLGGNIIQGWVDRDVGGELTVKPNTVWVGHRIEWHGEVRQVV